MKSRGSDWQGHTLSTRWDWASILPWPHYCNEEEEGRPLRAPVAFLMAVHIPKRSQQKVRCPVRKKGKAMCPDDPVNNERRSLQVVPPNIFIWIPQCPHKNSCTASSLLV